MKSHLTLVATICLLGPILLASASHSRTWHVNPEGTGDVPTIQAAIDSSAIGDTVSLAEGVFTQPTITCYKRGLTIVGEGGASKTFLHASGSGSILIAGIEAITIDGLTFEKGSSLGVSFYMGTLIFIKNCVFRELSGGLYFEMCGHVRIQGNLFYSDGSGAYFVDLNTDVEISGNTFFGNSAMALYLDNADYYNIWNNLICSNQYGIFGVASSIAFSCNNCWNNQINYDLISGVPDPTGTNGNISLDPQFCGVDPALSGNFFLQSDSPCAPGHHPNGDDCGVIGCMPVGCSETSAKRATWSQIKELYR